MFDQMTPSSWFWILVALMISCYARMSQQTVAKKLPGASMASVSRLMNF